VHLQPVGNLARTPEWKLTLWLGSLGALTTFNVGLWVWIAHSSPRTPYVETQLMLSGVYVLSQASGTSRRAATASDSQLRRHPSMAWEIWREEVPWMTLYFSIGVWTSLAMVLLEWVASRT
jgi:hypothetical protein